MPSVLIIDDDRDFCLGIEHAFKRLAPGLGIFPFHYGDDAIAHLGLCGTARPLPGLVLLDRRLPNGAGGFEVLRAIRALPALADVPVWMLSASQLSEDVELAWQLGADEYLAKPTGDLWPALVQRVLDCRPWRRGQAASLPPPKESWSGPGPSPAQNTLAVAPRALHSPPMSAAAMSPTPFVQSADERSFGDRFLEAFGWMTRKAEESVDPFQLALSRVCRAHKLTLVQLVQKGGSGSLVQARREALVDLLAEKWPEETLQSVVKIGETDMKRLRKALRERSGPKLVPGAN